MKKYLISACLLGLNTRYDGESNPETVFLEMVKTGEAIPFCPEQAGGLPTPRDPSEIIGGDGRDVLKGKARVITDKGQDVTEKFLKGAKETCKLAKLLGVDKAILKSKSPSCGCKCVYDGTFSGSLREGMGVTAAYLREHGINVIDSEQMPVKPLNN
ncbi:MAG TPA: DUF523 domain-containing protein [Thermoanaerobacterales bacterium]|jgi:uncharacterized protein YbbK (DUF523 family)|nr:DUF523 domain-containing protein [Thermoanaerobacterales bacterium]